MSSQMLKFRYVFLFFFIGSFGLKGQDLQLLHDRTFNTPEGKTLIVKGASGDIKLSGWDQDQVDVKIYGNDRAKERVVFNFEETSSGVTVIAEKDEDNWSNWNSIRIKFEVMVPRKFNCELNTAGGDIEMDNVDGDLNLKTSGGDIELEYSGGALSAKTSGGDISVKNHKGNGELNTSGGDVETYDFEGDVYASTSGGDIKLHVIDGKVDGSTSGGDVSLKYAGLNKGIELRTSGGDIRMSLPGDIDADVYLKSSGGDFSIDFPSAKLTRQTKSSFEGTFNNGGPTIECKTTGGDIRVKKN